MTMMKKIYAMTIAGVLLTALSSCKEDSPHKNLPEATDTTCTDQFISKIEPKGARDAFTSRCFERTDRISPTKNPKNWLEFNR